MTVDEAATHFEELLERVENGESIEITRDGQPVAQVSVAPKPEPKRDPEAIRKAIDEWERYRAEHNITLGGLSIRELIEEGWM